MAQKQHCFEECTFIVFGITGDLSKRKLIPALYKLIEDNRLCKFTLVGVASSNATIEELITKAQNFIPNPNPIVLEKLSSSFTYHQMDFNNTSAYETLHKTLRKLETTNNLPGNRIFYFATMPEHFMVITKNLVNANIIKKHPHNQSITPWSRVVFEKPFGHDLSSSRTINRYIAQVFDESQVFRIDHYLGKELVGNIAMTRFANRFFEPLWNNQHLASVNIIIKETIGIEGRGLYFDRHGVIKDMVQSHLLQLLALTTMEAPKKLSAHELRNAKASVLKKVTIDKVVRGQYEGYVQEKHVAPTSSTETFAAITLFINNKRWRGVPFTLITGKHLDAKESYIQLTFKQPECLLEQCPTKPNALRINIQPNEGIYLDLNVKALGSMHDVMPVTMEFCHSCLFGPNTPEAYEILLSDVMKGDQSAFVRNDEIEISWKIVEMIEKIKSPLHTYQPKSTGPHLE